MRQEGMRRESKTEYRLDYDRYRAVWEQRADLALAGLIKHYWNGNGREELPRRCGENREGFQKQVGPFGNRNAAERRQQ